MKLQTHTASCFRRYTRQMQKHLLQRNHCHGKLTTWPPAQNACYSSHVESIGTVMCAPHWPLHLCVLLALALLLPFTLLQILTGILMLLPSRYISVYVLLHVQQNSCKSIPQCSIQLYTSCSIQMYPCCRDSTMAHCMQTKESQWLYSLKSASRDAPNSEN